MSSYRDDEEQLQLVKNWLRQYGWVTLISIILAIAVVLGWQYWLRYQVGRSEKASTSYQNMVTYAITGKSKEAKSSADDLIQHYTSTPYAILASLWLAQQQVFTNDYDGAVKYLDWSLKHSKDKPLNNIITLRLAKVKLAQKKPNEALSLLKSLDKTSYAGFAAEARGDVYYSQNNLAAAKIAWQQALTILPKTNASYDNIRYKLANLPVEISGEKK